MVRWWVVKILPSFPGGSGGADSPAACPQFRGHGVPYAPLQRELRGLPECHGIHEQWPAGRFAGGTLRSQKEFAAETLGCCGIDL